MKSNKSTLQVIFKGQRPLSKVDLTLYDSLTNSNQIIETTNKNKVKIYCCGPTVYNNIHLGNARSAVVYDLLYRICQLKYENVEYVQNITDIDDKIINRAKERNIKIETLTQEVILQYNKDLEFLNCLKPTMQPKVTEEIDSIVDMISEILDAGFAYKTTDGSIYFDVNKYEKYGQLSNRKMEDLIENTRIQNEKDKRNSKDFLLWRFVDRDMDGHCYDTKIGTGRPGWHIECSLMSTKYLGDKYDIHGGGLDLIFPHHENELTQASCIGKSYAKYWVHNGFLYVNDEKMSKSLGNFITVSDIEKQGNSGIVVRHSLLSSIFNQKLNFSNDMLKKSEIFINKTHQYIKENISNNDIKKYDISNIYSNNRSQINSIFENTIMKNLNTPKIFAQIEVLMKSYSLVNAEIIFCILYILGLFNENIFYKEGKIFDYQNNIESEIEGIPTEIIDLVVSRIEAKKNKNYALADSIRNQIVGHGYELIDSANKIVIKLK